MATVILPMLWIVFDVVICLPAASISTPMSSIEVALWGAVGLALGIVALVSSWSEMKRAHSEEVKYERDRGELRTEIAKGSSFNEGAFWSIGRRLEEFSKSPLPHIQEKVAAVRTELAEIPALKPHIVYDGYDEVSVKHGDGSLFKYAHLFFRNEPTGSSMLDAAARTEFLEYVYGAPLFLVDAKWQEVPHDLGRGTRAANKIDLLPNKSSHPLDLVVRAPGSADCYALQVESPSNWKDERYRLAQGLYRARVTISCQGFTETFLFQVLNDGKNVQVLELEQVGEAINAKAELKR